MADEESVSKIEKTMQALRNEGILDEAKEIMKTGVTEDKIEIWYDLLRGFAPPDREKILSGRVEKPKELKNIYDVINKYSQKFEEEFDYREINLYDIDFYTTLAICAFRGLQEDYVNRSNFNHVKYKTIKNIEEHNFDEIDLKEDFSRVLNNYLSARKEDYTDHPLADFIRNEIPVKIRKIVNNFDKESDSKRVKGSAGMATWARVPWLSIMDERETTSAKEGVYLVYLFSEDMKRLYLTLMQGVTEFREKYDSKAEAYDALNKKGEEIQKMIDNLGDVKTDKNVNLASSGIGKDYEHGTILYKEYDRDNLPSNENLTKDLIQFLDIYNEYLTSKDEFTFQDDEIVEEDTISEEASMNFFEFIESQGYLYDKKIIENFLLALKVKPFVILTGNTGTGKTKLAQLYGKYLDRYYNSVMRKKDKDLVTTDVKVGKAYKHQGWTFPKSDLYEVLPELEDVEGLYEIEVDSIPGKGDLQLTPRLFYKENVEEISQRLRELADEDEKMRVNLKIKLNQDEGKFFDYELENNESLYEVIPVGSDWTDNQNIVGFYNVITNEYHKTSALDLILRAKNEEKPHLLLLDEMNLSHVERYFSDFLSAIESDETVPLHNHKKQLEIPTEIDIPNNLMIVGTVNVDETTYMFSPKVLDRANTIEFLPIPAEEYMNLEGEIEDPEGNVEYLENPLSNIDLREMSIEELRKKFSDINTSGGDAFWNVFTDELNKFQQTLKEANFDFAFRVIDEITKFMYVAWIYEGKHSTWENWRRYFDAQIKQKILPKLHGSQRELGSVLENLFELCYEGEVEGPIRTLDNLRQDPNVKYRSSALKLQEMSKTLYNQRYVSFTK